MANVFTGIRAYIFQCSYNSSSWLDDPSTLISDLETALGNVTDLDSYNRLLVSNVRNSSRKEIEIEIDGITYNGETKLDATENDSLITDLETAMNTITDLTYDHINIVNDVFTDDPTTGWPGQSYEEE